MSFDTQRFIKPVRKHGKTLAWRGGTLLAVATLAIQVWQEHDSNLALNSRNSALWSRIQAQEQEISDLRAKETFLQGELEMLLRNRNTHDK